MRKQLTKFIFLPTLVLTSRDFIFIYSYVTISKFHFSKLFILQKLSIHNWINKYKRAWGRKGVLWIWQQEKTKQQKKFALYCQIKQIMYSNEKLFINFDVFFGE
jgi:hypothetical protein